jgi:hypothetical protein
MTDDDGQPEEASQALAPTQKLGPAVTRSATVPAGLKYPEYRQYLREDFLYSCAYCSMTESEARGIRLTIDHYEPKSIKPELEDTYDNLMYACDECNTLKGDRSPTPEARAKDQRFFRVDADVRGEHFRLEENEVKGTTNVGTYTTLALSLNRGSLLRLRQLRRRLFDHDDYISEGIAALLSFPIDRLGPEVRAQAKAAMRDLIQTTQQVFDDFDELLLQMAKSPILSDGVTEEERRQNKERLAKLRQMDGILPTAWRGRKKGKKKRLS